MKPFGILELPFGRKITAMMLVIPVLGSLASCGGSNAPIAAEMSQQDPTPLDPTQQDPTQVDPTPSVPVVSDGNGPIDSESPVMVGTSSPGESDPEDQEGRISLVVEPSLRCAKVNEPLELVFTRRLAEDELPAESGQLPNVSGLVSLEQGYGTSLYLISRTDESINFQMTSQDIVGLTASIENGSLTTYVAGYNPDAAPRFIMRKPVPRGCLYAFKVDDYCVSGLTRSAPISFSRYGVSMTASGCELENPDDLSVIDVPASED
ncbi:MAG: hypothetical protein AB8B87_16620 [Granulosicoccus sp.]